MGPDLKWLKTKGVSAADYKKIFTLPLDKYPPRLRARVRLHADRIRDGRTNNLSEWRSWKAIEDAYDVPFNQTTPTIVRSILDRNLSQQQVLEELKQWGLSESELFIKVELDNGKAGYKFNEPVFFNIFLPIVKSYTEARLAALFNERNQSPFLPYHPLKRTYRNQVLAEVMTDIASTISTWYGYPAVLRQSIQHMLKYGIMLAFPKEQWHCERQVIDGETVIVKEGVRYIHPHPTRMFYDLRYPLTSINSDSGTEWLFHWEVVTYGDILDNRAYWNRNSIFAGTNWFESPLAGAYFKEYFPCNMAFPVKGFQNTRQDRLAYYNSGNRDQAVFLTHMFDKISPFELGLGDYKHKVWHRFVYAGDDTCIYCEPYAYTPPWFMGYAFDENASRTSSLSLELIPWQDQLGNALSQLTLTSRQNLANVIFYDTNAVDVNHVRALENKGEARYRSMMFLPFDSMKWARQQISAKDAFVPVQLGKTPITELLQAIPITLNLMERVLQISAQEVGSAATHQQGNKEIEETKGASQNRLSFTGSYVDEGIDAWKRQIHDAATEHMDPEITAEVSAEIPDLEQHLESIGFKVQGRGDNKVLIKGHKKVLRLESWARSNEGPERPNDLQVAQVFFQVIGVIAQNPDLHQALGTKNIAKILEEAAILAGAPKDFRLLIDPKANQGIPPQVMQALQQVQQMILQSVAENVAKPAAEETAKVQAEIQQQGQQLQAMEQIVGKLQKVFDVLQQTQDKNAIRAAETKQKMELRAAEIQQKMQLEAQKTAREEARKDQQTQAAVERERAKTTATIEHERAKTGATIHADQLTAQAEASAAATPAPNKVSESITYKDAPPSIKSQIEEQAGLVPATEEEREKHQASLKPKPAAKPSAVKKE